MLASARDILRLDDRLVARLVEQRDLRRTAAGACLLIVLGCGAYGFAFGLWRAPLQGVYAAIKLPALFFAVTGVSGGVNAMLAQVLRSGLSARQVAVSILIGLAITAALLGGLAPVAVFLVTQVPEPDPNLVGLPVSAWEARDSMGNFRLLLLAHVSVIGACGLVGYARLWLLLLQLVPDFRVARRVLFAWIAVTGFAGCEIAWLFSPYLCKPTFAPHFIAQTYSEGNFYEQIWRATTGGYESTETRGARP